jgi:hypothetical protein
MLENFANETSDTNDTFGSFVAFSIPYNVVEHFFFKSFLLLEIQTLEPLKPLGGPLRRLRPTGLSLPRK